MSGLVHARSPAGGASTAPRLVGSPASIAPVGLEMAAEGDGSEESAPEQRRERAQQTGSIRLPLKRRHLGGIVVAAVAGCGLILVAAVIARVSHASNQPASPAAPSTVVSASANDFKPMILPPSPPRESAPAITPASSDAPTTGTVRLQRPATAGRVWIDGKKLTSSSALVSCGVHQIKVGAWARARPVQIPCGGEIVVSK
jgi:hypothetical protein